jgi:hypothetical protein
VAVVRHTFSGGGRAGSGRTAALGRAVAMLVAMSIAAVCAPAALAKPPSKTQSAKYLKADRDLVDVYAAVEGAKLGVVLPGGPEHFIEVLESPKAFLTVHAYGKTYRAGAVTDIAWNSAGTEAIGARITIYGLSHSSNPNLIRAVVAHEVFHVFEARMSVTEARSNGHAGWLEEGAASWVESDLVSHDPTARQEWGEYLESPKRGLFTRVYSAIGFFAHMSSSHISPWTHFKAMFEAESSAASYAAAGVGDDFLDSESSVFFREPSFGSDWEQEGQESATADSNVPSRAEASVAPAKVKVTKESALGAAPYADGVFDLSLKSMPADKPVLELLLTKGNARVHSKDGGDVNKIVDGSLRVCSSTHGCDCPGGPPSDYPQMREGDLAITGGPTGGLVRLIPVARCETLVGPVSCEHLLPGFSNEPEKVAGAAAGVHFAIESGNHAAGEYTYVCLFQEKGELEGPETEQSFHGVIAVSVSVSRFPAEGDATRQMQTYTTYPGPSGPVAYVPVTGAGEDARLANFAATTGTHGEPECASAGVVRVHNVVATFALAGDEEACGGSAEALLRTVAGEL